MCGDQAIYHQFEVRKIKPYQQEKVCMPLAASNLGIALDVAKPKFTFKLYNVALKL